MEDGIECFVKNHEGFQFNERKTRVLCTITGHELPCDITAIKAYMNGKKYKQLTKNGTCNLSKVAEYKKYLVPSKTGRNMLYCGVTRKLINNIPSHIENHITGRKFQRDLKKYLKNYEKSDECSTEEQSFDAEIERSVEEEDAVEEQGNEEEEPDRKESEGFVGGIWYPDGINFDKLTVEEDGMDIDPENLHGDENVNDTFNRKKIMLKRRMKDNKKNKRSVAISRKRSKPGLM